MTVGAYVLEIDWNDDGDFGDANEDVSSYLTSISYRRGRDKPDPITGRYVPGTLRARLRNTNGLFSPRNASGALYGNLKPGRRIRFRMTSPTASNRFTGYITKIRPVSSGSAYVDIEATTGLGTLRNARIRAPIITSGDSGAAADTILDAVNWSATARAIDTGASTLRTVGFDEYALTALRKIENSELGFLFDDADGNIVFKNRHHRTGLTSAVTFSDDPADNVPRYDIGAEYDEPDDTVVNVATAKVRLFDPDMQGAIFFAAILFPFGVWAHSIPFTIGPGESVTLTARMNPQQTYEPGGADDSKHYFDSMSIWFSPSIIDADSEDVFWGNYVRVSGADPNDIAVDLVGEGTPGEGTVSYSHTTDITITNNGTATATIESVGIGGVPRAWVSEAEANAVDDTSRGVYGDRAYPHPSELLYSVNEALNQAQYIVLVAATPRLTMRLPFVANPYFSDLMPLELSDRVTVEATKLFTYFGINEDFYIEGIEERIANFREPVHEMTFELSAAAEPFTPWRVNVSQLNGTDVLSY